MCKASEHGISKLKYVTKLVCQNSMSVSGRNWNDCVNLSKAISMIGMNVKQVYSEWYDTVSYEESDNICMLKEMVN